MQVCSGCNTELELTSENFYRRPDAPSGFRKQCKMCISKRAKGYYYQDHEKTKLKVAAYKREEYKRRKSEILAANKRYQESEKGKLNNKAWSKRYYAQGKVKARKNTAGAKRKAAKLQATPIWAKQGYIDMFYHMAQTEAARIGKAVHVDHIIPLQSKTVCGLHCEDNLQLLASIANLQKGLNYNTDGTCIN